jgi:DNA-binding transcriptional ArsR family regulator
MGQPYGIVHRKVNAVKAVPPASADTDRAIAICRALGNPARMLIVRELARQAGCVNSDFLALLPLAHSTISGHLRVLREAGIVALCDDDRSYCLEPGAFAWLAEFSRVMAAEPLPVVD